VSHRRGTLERMTDDKVIAEAAVDEFELGERVC
jgi:hypothetical protein